MDPFPYLEPLAVWLWKTSWQASVLVLLVLIAQSLFRKRISPQWSYALWLLVVVRLMLPISPESSWSLFNLTSGSREPVAAAQADRGFPASVPDESGPFAPETPFIPLVPDEPPWTSREATPVQPSRTSPQWGFWQTILMGVWLSGAFVLTLRMVLINLRFARSLRCARPIEDTEIIDLFEQCRADAGLRRRPDLLETTLVESPSLFGFIHPILLLPPGMAARFSPAQLRHIFLHELAHIRRGDVIIDWILACLQILHWFNPVIWLAFRRMRADRELACDALAMRLAGDKGSKSYGQTIIKVLETCHQPTTVAGLVGILENPNEMKQRLRTIATFGKSPRGYILALLLMSTLALFALTDATGNQETASEILDPTAPAPRELVLDTLRQIQELPARDRIHWQEAIAADRIPENAGILLAFLNARIREVDLTRFVPPIVTLPDGREVRTMHVGLLGPNLGANITQEDLNGLAALMAEGHEQVLEYFAELERRRHRIPLSLHADDFAIFLVSRDDLTAPTRQAVVTGEALQRVQRILDDRENPVGLRLFLDQNGVSRLREATRDAPGSHLVFHGPEGLRLGSIQIGYGSISSVPEIFLAGELVETVIDEWEERSDPRRHEMEKILHIAQASIIYAHDNEEQLPGEGVTEIHDVARELAMEAGLNVATAWISGLEPSTTEQEIEPDSTVLDERRESLRPEFAARDVIAVDYATHLNMSLPSTTPIAWTRGLREDGTWDEQGAMGGAGGYIVFMGGNVTYYENLNADGGQLRRADGTLTANILEVLPPKVRVVGSGPGTLHGKQGKAPATTP